MRYLRLLAISGLHLAAVAGEIPAPADAPQPLPPRESAAAFVVPEGFRVEAVVSEPLIASPTAVCWDERGRMFVGELHGYNLEGQLDIEAQNATGVLDTQVRRIEAGEQFKRAAKPGTYGVVKLLTSSHGDGRIDHAEVWAKDLPPVYGLIPARGGVIVACVPQIVYLADKDGSGKPDTREVLFDGFAVGEMWRGINCPLMDADGWITFGQGWPGGTIHGPHLAAPVHLPQSDFRIRPDGSAIEPVTGATGTFGFAVTASGDRFTTNTTQPANFVAPLPWRYLMRNPDVAAPAPEARSGDSHAYSRSKPHPWRSKRASDPAYYKFYHDRYGAAESDPDGWFTAACGPLVYRDSALPGLQGNYFVCEPALNLIHRALITQDGARLTVHRAPGEETSEFMSSTDAWSHPIALTHGPDGALWIVDFYREIIEDYSAIPRHLQQQYGVYRGHDYGRILRLTHRDAPAAPVADLSAMPGPALARELASTLLWRRQTAARLLREHMDRSAIPTLIALLADPHSPPETLIATARTLEALDALPSADLATLVRHPDPGVRIQALQLADVRFSRSDGASLVAAVVAQAGQEVDERVAIQLALSLGQSSTPEAFAALAQLARTRLPVRWMATALLSSLHGRCAAMLAELARDPGESGPLLTPLARAVAVGRNVGELDRALTAILTLPAARQCELLAALGEGWKGAPGIPPAAPAHALLARLTNAEDASVRQAAQALERRLRAPTASAALTAGPAVLPRVSHVAVPPEVDAATVARYTEALKGVRNRERGHALFLQHCALCHRIKDEGAEVGPDLLGELGAEESLIRDILLPSERIRPGYETVIATTIGNDAIMGILVDDGATSLTLVAPGGIEHVLLRKDISDLKRLPTSLMPPFAALLQPFEVADVIAWLRSNLGVLGSK